MMHTSRNTALAGSTKLNRKERIRRLMRFSMKLAAAYCKDRNAVN